ncbi:MAG: tetratricopeptide repeat protein [Spirochaetes bacterium]|nr:tetratricopeptide repeat protein [Spirochaetota bacterium]
MSKSLPALLALSIVLITTSCNDEDYAEGLTAYREERFDDAYHAFTRALDLSPQSPLHDYTYYYAGRSALYLRYYSNAASLFSASLSLYSNSLIRGKTEQYNAYAGFMNRGGTLATLTNMPKYLQVFIGNNAAQALIAATNTNAAYEILRYLVDIYENADAAAALHRTFRPDARRLRDTIPDTAMKLARGLHKSGKIAESLLYVTDLAVLPVFRDEAKYRIAWCNDLLGHADKAESLYRDYLAGDSGAFRERATYRIVELLRQRGRYDRALVFINDYIEHFPKSGETDYMHRRLVSAYMAEKNMPCARDALENAVKKYPKSTHINLAARAYLRKMFLDGTREDCDAALGIMRAVVTNTDRYDYYLSWERLAAMKFGDETRAKAAVAATLTASRNPYFIQEAYPYADTDLLSAIDVTNELYLRAAKNYIAASNYTAALASLNRIQFITTAVYDVPTPLLTECRGLTERILRRYAFVDAFFRPMSDDVIIQRARTLSPHLRTAVALVFAGDRENALNEAVFVRTNSPTSYDAFRALETVCAFAEDYGPVFKYTTPGTFQFPSTYSHWLLPPVLCGYLYPEYYHTLITSTAKRYSIEPAFVYALIRTESAFDSSCVSWVNARGLMQLMSDTAIGENRSLGKARLPYVDLHRPAHNVLLGTSHLAKLFKDYHSNEVMVLAAYNAGAGSVQRWKNTIATNDMSYYARMLDYPETEYYIEKVLRARHFYRLLNDGE